MRVLVCGGRDYDNGAKAFEVLDRVHATCDGGITTIIEGGARGADRLAFNWHIVHSDEGVDHEAFHAEWGMHGKAAGAIRNSKMLAEGKPDLVVAFPGGRGTADMVAKARKAGVEVLVVQDDSRKIDGR